MAVTKQEIEEVKQYLNEWKERRAKRGTMPFWQLEKLIETRLDMAREEIMTGNFRSARQLFEEAIQFGKERMVDLLGEEKAKKIWME